MRVKSIIVCIFTLLFMLCGCSSEKDVNENQQALEIYDLDINFYNQYDVCDLENIYIYFPVVTNKEITSTEPSGVGARFNLKDKHSISDIIKVKLIIAKQDKINIKYNDYFISFLKYKLEFSTNMDKNNYESINLNDTKLWILCNDEIQSANYNNDYLKINIMHNENEQNVPNWEQCIDKMMQDIKCLI